MRKYSEFLASDRVAIFLFHGVIPERRHAIRNYTNKHILLARFREILQDLVAWGKPVSMPDIVDATHGKRTLPKHAFAVTFDDGFGNNYSVAAPTLRELGIPATFYITTGFIESNSSSWIDMIEYAVEKQKSFNLDLPGVTLGGTYETREQKIALLDQIRQRVKNDSSIDPYEFAGAVCRQLGITAVAPDPDLDQKMSWEQIEELGRNNLFTIGGHSHTHRILTFLSQTDLEREITISLEMLQPHLRTPITHYSYPEGLLNCYSDQVIDVLRRHRIVCSPSAEHGINAIGDDLFHLKRIMVAV